MADNKSIDEWESVFKFYDKNNTGTLDFEELKDMLKSNDSTLTETQIKRAFAFFDSSSGDKTLTLEEFVNGMKKMDNIKEILTNAFNECDKDKSGALNKEESKAVLLKIFPGLTDDEVEVIFTEADKDKDGKITLEEFLSTSDN